MNDTEWRNKHECKIMWMKNKLEHNLKTWWNKNKNVIIDYGDFTFDWQWVLL